LECVTGNYTDDPVIFTLAATLERWRERAMIGPCASVNLGVGNAISLDAEVDSGNKQEIAGARLDGADPGEEVIRERVANGPEAQLIERALVAEQIDDLQYLPPLSFRMVQPAE
jgi:hypothetical protein